MNIKIDLGPLNERMEEVAKALSNPEYLLRPICFDVIDLMTKRIHIDGVASDGTAIGTYSPQYMKVRTGQGFMSDVVSRGANKGKPREQYNRTSDTKVICSLTRQLEGDWNVIETDNGYGVGFINSVNFQKTGWLQNTYKKKIFELSSAEEEYVRSALAEKIDEILSNSST